MRCNLKNIMKVTYVFILLSCFFITTCNNSIMETWWEDDKNLINGRITGGGTDYFAVVVFDSDGGTPQPKAIKVAYGVVVGRLRSMTKGDSSFLGWYDERGNMWDIETRPVTKNDVNGDGILLLTARWVDNPSDIFTVTFDTATNGFLTTVDPQTIARGGKVVQPVPPTPPVGYGFAGWYYNGQLWDFNNTVTGNMVLVARRDTPFCIVRFVENGGTRPDGFTTLTHEFAISTSYGIVPDPGPLVNEGFYFGGWYTDDITFSDKWDFTNRKVSAGLSALTLYAKWIPYNRTVIFDQNGGQGISPNVFTVHIGDRLTNPGTPIRTGYTFLGWYHDLNSSSLVDFSRDTVPEPETITDMDPIYIYAGWTINKLRVTFNIEGRGTVDSQEVDFGERVEIPAITPSSSTDYFNGLWYTDPSCTPGTEWDFDTRITSDRILYGKYNVGDHRVRFILTCPSGKNISGFDTPAEQLIPHNGKAVEPFMPPVMPPSQGTPVDMSRVSFYCWSRTPIIDGGTTAIPPNIAYDFDTPVTGDLILYARWVEPIPDMVWVPRGSFIMGDTGVSGSPAAYHAYPTRRVTLDGYFISRYMVTQVADGVFPTTGGGLRGYAALMGNNPSQFTAIDTRPVENVSWDNAMDYCDKLNSDEGLTPHNRFNMTEAWATPGYRLPTEAEWEYAARGGANWTDNFTYAGSNNANDVAWYNVTVKTRPSGQQSTQRVGLLAPNQLGIYDMSGNLSEWCYDWFASYSNLGTGPFVNPIGADSGTEKVRRGGGWLNAVSNVRVAVRNSDTPDTTHWGIGFRIVRGPSRIF